MTPTEAASVWCPRAGVSSQWKGTRLEWTTNRGRGDVGSVVPEFTLPPEENAPRPSFCCVSKFCMNWRWVDPANTTNDDPGWCAEFGVDPNAANRTWGICAAVRAVPVTNFSPGADWAVYTNLVEVNETIGFTLQDGVFTLAMGDPNSTYVVAIQVHAAIELLTSNDLFDVSILWNGAVTPNLVAEWRSGSNASVGAGSPGSIGGHIIDGVDGNTVSVVCKGNPVHLHQLSMQLLAIRR